MQHIICLIDDDRIYQFTTKRILDATGLCKEILVFGNGFEAISYLEEHVHQPELLPHVIFLDINMPTMDGWEFLEAFGLLQSKLRQPIHIYMVSSSMDDYDIQKAKEYHLVTDYVIKPINKERFEELIHKTESPE